MRRLGAASAPTRLAPAWPTACIGLPRAFVSRSCFHEPDLQPGDRRHREPFDRVRLPRTSGTGASGIRAVLVPQQLPLFVIAIGFVGPSLGLPLGATALAGTLGIALGIYFPGVSRILGTRDGPAADDPVARAVRVPRRDGATSSVLSISLMGYNVVSTVLVLLGSAGRSGV